MATCTLHLKKSTYVDSSLTGSWINFVIRKQGFTSPFFTSLTVEKLLSNAMMSSAPTSTAKSASYGTLAAIKATAVPSQHIDILLSNVFPTDITAFSSAPLPSPSFPSPSGAAPLSEVVRRTKPRYHFVAGGGGNDEDIPLFWEREPIVWDDENGRVMRFVSLGAFGQTPPTGKKQRVSWGIMSEERSADIRLLCSGSTPSRLHHKLLLLLHLPVRRMPRKIRLLSSGAPMGRSVRWTPTRARISVGEM